jgi:hypothetical protein
MVVTPLIVILVGCVSVGNPPRYVSLGCLFLSLYLGTSRLGLSNSLGRNAERRGPRLVT